MENLPYLGNHYILASPTQKLLTNAIVDGVDSVVTSTDVYPHIRTATVRDDATIENFRSVATDLTLTAGMKYCFGVFLANDLTTEQSRMYNCKGALCMIVNEANQFIKHYPIFGRLNGPTPVTSDVAASNLLQTYVILPERSSGLVALNTSTAGQLVKISYDETVVINGSALDGDPVFTGFVIENWGAADVNLDAITATMMIRTNIPQPIATFSGV
nr:MAG: hypothetical protein [Microvirus sp.]